MIPFSYIKKVGLCFFVNVHGSLVSPAQPKLDVYSIISYKII